MKKILSLLLLLAVIISAASCVRIQDDPPPSQPDDIEVKKPDRVESIPVLDSYLKETNQVAHLFFKDNELVNVVTMDVKETLTEAQITEFSQKPTRDNPYLEALSDEHCFARISVCIENYPSFNIIGVVYNTSGYPTIYPVGINKGEKTIKYVAGEPTAFGLVDPFTSLDEGRKAFENYWQIKNAILSEMQIFKWTTTNPYYNEMGYIRRYTHECVYALGLEKETQYLWDYDNMIVVPLTDINGKEDVYILHLLYYHNELIAELVLENKGIDSEIVYVPAWQNIAPKDEMGKYIPIAEPRYTEITKEALNKNKDFSMQGVIFNGTEFVPVGYLGDSFEYYDITQHSFVPASKPN